MGTHPFGYVLLVDDSRALTETLAEILVDEGYGVVASYNGREALTHLRQAADPPEVILLDLSMPVMSGWEFRAEQLRDERLRDIPVVLVSAEPDLPRHAFALRVRNYFHKPVPVQQLMALLRSFLSQTYALSAA
jgi:CheY-like chemotaxis protein